MAIFSAYFDASGHPNQHDVLTVAGYAAAVDSWIRFETEWQEILRSEGLSTFHATDFASSEREFVSWRGKEPEQTQRRRVLVEKLVACINRRCASLFRASVYIPDFERVNSEYTLSEAIGVPYTVCCCQVTYALRRWAREREVLDTLLYYFEHGDKGKGNFEEFHRKAYGQNPKFLTKADAIPFQAADFAAWKMRIVLHEANKPTHTLETGGRLLQSIAVLGNLQKDAGVLNEWSFREHCRIQGIPKRNL